MQKFWHFIKHHKILSILICITTIISTIPLLIYQIEKIQIYKSIDNVKHYEVGIVFGASVKPDGTPSDMLLDRLNTAALLYENNKVDKLLVSGDNRFEHYNEPEAMYKYLTEIKDIPSEDVIRDFAGRRTYDTCIRANTIWSIDSALLITQGYHLPRAIYTCEQLGIDSEGYSATLHNYVGGFQYEFREYFAIEKTIIDLYIWPPNYVGGEKETLQ